MKLAEKEKSNSHPMNPREDKGTSEYTMSHEEVKELPIENEAPSKYAKSEEEKDEPKQMTKARKVKKSRKRRQKVEVPKAPKP